MIELTLREVADIVVGELRADPQAIVQHVTADSRDAGIETLFAALAGERVDGHDFVAAAIDAGSPAALVSKAVDADCIVVDDVIVALSRLTRYQLDHAGAIVLALTGSHGKTSVKDLLSHILRSRGPTIAPFGSFNNELGVPLTVLRADRDTEFVVVEMGARGIGHIAWLCSIAPPDVAAVLNVGSSHVGEFGSTEAIASAKGEIVEALRISGVAVLNADDPLVVPMIDRTSGRVVTFGTKADISVTNVRLDAAGEPHFTLSYRGRSSAVHVPQIGRHVAINAAAAVAIAVAAGVEFDVATASLATAEAASAMRMQRTVRSDGVVIINDAYNANPESMAAGLRAVAEMPAVRRLAVLGPMLELGEQADRAHFDVGVLARDAGFERVVVVGRDAAQIASGAGDIAEVVDNVDMAVATLSACLTEGDVVLVKASRGCRLERVVDGLSVEHGGESGGSATEGPRNR